MVIPVPAMIGVPMPVVHIVDVIPMRHGDVPAPLTVLVCMVVVGGVPVGLALIGVVTVHAVQMPVVRVVHVIVVRYGNVPAVRAVLMGVLGVGRVRNGTQSGLRPSRRCPLNDTHPRAVTQGGHSGGAGSRTDCRGAREGGGDGRGMAGHVLRRPLPVPPPDDVRHPMSEGRHPGERDDGPHCSVRLRVRDA
ncbi:hypothetical protein GCM10009612_44680 [Streptomyces beijiangensis]